MNEFPPSPSEAALASHDERLRTLVELFGQDWVDDFNDPIVFRSYSLCSKAAKQFYIREFQEMSRILYAETIYRRRPNYDQSLLDTFILEVAKKLAEVQAALAAHCQRLLRLCESNGQPTDAAFLHPHHLLVPIVAAHATSYMRCLVKLDELHQLSGSATLNGVIDANQRKLVELQARKAIRSLGGFIRNEYAKIRAEAVRVRAAPDVHDPEVEQGEGPEPQVVMRQDTAALDHDENGQSGHESGVSGPLPASADLQPARLNHGLGGMPVSGNAATELPAAALSS